MPVTQMVWYLTRFKLADGEHIAASQAEKAEGRVAKDRIFKQIRSSLNPPVPDYPQGNPAFAVIEMREATLDEINAAVAKLKDTPGRVGLDDLAAAGELDTPNRALHEPAITESIAADQTPG